MKRALWLGLVIAASAPLVVGWATAGCDNTLVRRPGSDEGGGGQAPDEVGGGGFSQATGLVVSSTGAGLDAYVEPPCTDEPPPLEDYACDPYDQGNGDCAPGDGCYIFVEYPGTPCGQETFGSLCLAEGIGGQGDACGGPFDCQAGLVCVVADSGTQCVQYCPLEGDSGCTDGLVCEPIDVEGFGGCI